MFFSVLTNYSRASFSVWVHPPSPFFIVLLNGVHLALYSFTFHCAVFIFTVQVYCYIIHSTLSILLLESVLHLTDIRVIANVLQYV